MTTPAGMPSLPQALLDTIGEYGMARSDGVSALEIQHRWELLIDGIKGYALDAGRAAALEEAASECDALASVEGIAQRCAAAIRARKGKTP